MIVVADTSALLAAFDESEAAHGPARAVMSSEHLVISPIVLTELDYLVRRDFGFNAALAAVESLTDRFAVSSSTSPTGSGSSSPIGTAQTGSSPSTCGTFVR